MDLLALLFNLILIHLLCNNCLQLPKAPTPVPRLLVSKPPSLPLLLVSKPPSLPLLLELGIVSRTAVDECFPVHLLQDDFAIKR